MAGNYAPARKPYRIGLLFTHKNRDFGAISVTERICAASISKAEIHTTQEAVQYSVNKALAKVIILFACIKPFCTFLCRHFTTTTCMWNLMMQNFVENVQKPATTKFSPSFLQFIVRKTSLVPRRYNYIWQGQRVEIMSMKLEVT